MRNYNEQIEAAYLSSKRQGDMMRDRERERSPHEDRRNRYIEEQPGTQRYRMEPQREGGREREPVGNNRGKGPRNYRRPDERIKEMVCEVLWDHPYLDASAIEVEVKNAEVILTGSVDNRSAKRLAEDLVESVPGVVNAENRIRVSEDKK